MMRRILHISSTFIIVVASFASLMAAPAAQALSGSDFQPGRIIDDQIFYDSTSMSPLQIENFLKSQMPQDSNGNAVCDNAGLKPYYGTYGGVTYNGNILRKNLDPTNYPAPYTCLFQYIEDTKVANSGILGSGGNNLGNPNWVPSAADCPVDTASGLNTCSSAYIIYNAAQQYTISPKVLIVLLQKEEGIVTDDWPWYPEYKAATGYGCPDTAACSSTYYGFYNQVHNAARQFRIYANTPNSFNYTVGANAIPYHPGTTCGTDPVTIQNQATASLYDYTPYVPNQAALNNLMGTGDACSSYGNRNFWRYYNNWFGSTILACGANEPTLPQVIRLYNPTTYEQFYSSYQCEVNTLTKQYGYLNAGAAFNTTPATATGAVPVYRLYDAATGLHHWTASQAEVTAITAPGAAWKLEGAAFYVVSPSLSPIYPVYRLYNPKTYVHYWTLSLQDANSAVKYSGYTLEGPAFNSQ